MRSTFAPFIALLALSACAADEAAEASVMDEAPVAAAPSAPAPTADQLALAEQVRTGTMQYQDVAAAERAGYIPDPSGECVDGSMMGMPELGGMGIHYFRPDLLGLTSPNPPVTGSDGVIDVDAPEVLVYEPQADGTMQLVAAEYLVFSDAWTAAGNTEAPSLAGVQFATMTDDPATPMDEAHGFAPHHELHVWVHRENPAGLFAEFNPSVTCPGSMAGHAGM